MTAAARRRHHCLAPNAAADAVESAAAAGAAADENAAADCDGAAVARADNKAAARAVRTARRRREAARCRRSRSSRRRRASRSVAAVDSKADSGEVAPEPPRSDGNNARRADNNFPPQPDHQSFARRGQVGDIFRRREKLSRESLRPARWTRTFGIMDFGDVHPCGYDRAYVCSDRFSWFAVPPTP